MTILFRSVTVYAIIAAILPVWVASNQLANDHKIFKGKHLRLPAMMNPPLLFVRKGPDGNLTYDGVDKQMAEWLSASLKTTYTFVPLDGTLVEKQGRTKTMIDMLLNGTIDCTAAISRRLSRMLYMDFTYPYIIDSYRIASPWPREKNQFLAPLMPFQLSVWIMIIFCLLFTASFLAVLTIHEDNYGIRSFVDFFSRYFKYLFVNMLGQDDYIPFSSHSSRITLAAWCLGIIVVVNSYSSNYTSHLTIPEYESTVNSIEDLAKRPDIPLTALADSYFLKILLDARAGPYKIVADAIRKHPEYLYRTIPEFMEKIFSGKHSHINVATYIEILIANDYKERETCRLTMSKYLPMAEQLFFGLPKNGPYNAMISYRVMYLWETGLLYAWIAPYRGRFEQCIVEPVKPRMARLKLKDFYSAFLLLAVGTGLSLLVFAFELIHNIRKRYRN